MAMFTSRLRDESSLLATMRSRFAVGFGTRTVNDSNSLALIPSLYTYTVHFKTGSQRISSCLMATVGERLARIEQIALDAGRRLDSIEHDIHGGGDVERKDSIRGRLHTIEGTLAGMVLRRNVGLGLLKGWQSAVLVMCGLATAAAAWYAALSG